MFPLLLPAIKTKLSSWIITIGKKAALGVTPTYLGVQLLVGCRSHGSTRWQCHTQTWAGVLTSSRNAASLPLPQGNGTHRKHREELGGSRRTALGLGPKTMKLSTSVLTKPAQFCRSHLLSLPWRMCAINEEVFTALCFPHFTYIVTTVIGSRDVHQHSLK